MGIYERDYYHSPIYKSQKAKKCSVAETMKKLSNPDAALRAVRRFVKY